MTSDAFHTADGVHLEIGTDGETVSLRCDTHPEFDVPYKLGPERKIPAAWAIGTLLSHLETHFSTPVETPAEDTGSAISAVAELDEFGREIAARCIWAKEWNQGDPDKTWPDSYQIAVALVLGNHLYLQQMGPGPGYSPAQAAVLLVRGMANPPADLDRWIRAVRNQVIPPDQREQGRFWTPTPRPEASP